MKGVNDNAIGTGYFPVGRRKDQLSTGLQHPCKFGNHLPVLSCMLQGFKRNNFIEILIGEIKLCTIQYPELEIAFLPMSFALINVIGSNITTYHFSPGFTGNDIGAKAGTTGNIQYNII